jgi:hypothetical protein
MQVQIDINELPHRLDDVRGLSGDSEIVLTSGNDPIARVVPLNMPPQDTAAIAPRLSNPFLGEFTEEDFQEAKAILALKRPGYTTEEVIARVQGLQPR